MAWVATWNDATNVTFFNRPINLMLVFELVFAESLSFEPSFPVGLHRDFGGFFQLFTLPIT
jgi:hypothetical protein